MIIPSWFRPRGSPGYNWIVVHLVFVFQLTVPVLSVAKCWYLKVWTWCLQAITKKLHKQASVSGYFPTSTYINKRQIGVMCRWGLLLCVLRNL